MRMISKITLGTCLLCRVSVTKQEALKHGMECLQASGWPIGEEPSLLITIQGQQSKNYWLVVLARHDARLGDLELLIRDVWMEDCERMSSFLIEDVIYETDDEPSSGAMDVPLTDIIAPGSKFTYHYSFDPIVSLDLEVVGETPIIPPDDGTLCLIARNSPPTIPCEICGGKADLALYDHYGDLAGYYCRRCFDSGAHDPDYAGTISNSPGIGTCDYVKDPGTALLWYPPGWNMEEIDPDEPDSALLNDEEKTDAAITAIMQDVGPDIDAFLEAEIAAYGDKGGNMAADTVISFCTLMYLLYRADIGAWSATNVQRCLIEDLSQKLIFPDEWPENAVPILCRFLERMEASGRITNASELITALKEVECAFQTAATNPEKSQTVFKHILMRAEEEGIDTGDVDAFFRFAVEEFAEMTGFDLDDEGIQKELSALFEGGMPDMHLEDLRIPIIFTKCEDFCRRFRDDTILECCSEILEDLLDHPSSPLMRGDAALWSAAIIYAVCQDMDLIRPGRGAPPIGQEISSFFGFSRSSIRNKVRTVRALLSD